MDEALRHEIVQRHQGGASVRAIAKELGISRGAVVRALARVQAQREGRAAPLPKPRARRGIVDPFEPILKELLAKYPNLTVERALQELRQRGFTGGYTVVRQRVRLLRPRPAPVPVPRFETSEGAQAQMDFGVHDIDFTREGRRRVYLFSYLLGYSRRQYLRWVESMDLLTTMREHVQAFHHLGGVARVCLYDNFKAVVLWHDADGPLYNPKFLAFATHYGFRPQACRVRRPQTKGKVERKFYYIETSLLNGRTFDTLEHLNEVTQQWLANVADVRVLRDFKETPRQRHAREQPHLLPLPASDFDTALVVYRHVNVEGFVAYRQNCYSVPWSYIGQVLPLRVSDDEVIVYSIALEEIARHRLVPSTQSGVRQIIKSHHPADDPNQRTLLLRQRFGELGPSAVQFLDGLLAKQAQGKLQAQQLLALLAQYQRDDVLAALERAVRFGAFSLAAMRRILAAQARPKRLLDELAELHKDALDPSLCQEPIGPRPTSDYQHLLAPEEANHEPAEEQAQEPPEAGLGQPVAGRARALRFARTARDQDRHAQRCGEVFHDCPFWCARHISAPLSCHTEPGSVQRNTRRPPLSLKDPAAIMIRSEPVQLTGLASTCCPTACRPSTPIGCCCALHALLSNQRHLVLVRRPLPTWSSMYCITPTNYVAVRPGRHRRGATTGGHPDRRRQPLRPRSPASDKRVAKLAGQEEAASPQAQSGDRTDL